MSCDACSGPKRPMCSVRPAPCPRVPRALGRPAECPARHRRRPHGRATCTAQGKSACISPRGPYSLPKKARRLAGFGELRIQARRRLIALESLLEFAHLLIDDAQVEVGVGVIRIERDSAREMVCCAIDILARVVRTSEIVPAARDAQQKRDGRTAREIAWRASCCFAMPTTQSPTTRLPAAPSRRNGSRSRYPQFACNSSLD